MRETITREKHPGRVAQGHKLAALMKNKKEQILHNKEQPTVQSTEQFTVQSTEHPSVQSTEHPSVQSTEQPSVQSNGAYVHGVGILAALVIGVCVFFTYNTFQPKIKNLSMKKRINDQNDVIYFRKIYNK